MLRALLYAYVLGGLTFLPLLVGAMLFITIYTSVPVGDADGAKRQRGRLAAAGASEGEGEGGIGVGVEGEGGEKDGEKEKGGDKDKDKEREKEKESPLTNDVPRTRKGWLTMRRTFEASAGDASYVTLVRAFLDARSKDPRRSRPRDMWFAALKGSVLFLYEDEAMAECEAAIEMRRHRVVVCPEGLPDGELFAKRNAICLRPRGEEGEMPSVTREMALGGEGEGGEKDEGGKEREKDEAEKEAEREKDAARAEALDCSTPWFIFVRSNVEMEDWYFALLHASEQTPQAPTLAPLLPVFDPTHMAALIATLDEAPDVIPMRWLNALLGRVFLSHYRTHALEAYIIGRLMKKLGKVKRPAFLTEIAVTHVAVGNRAPMLSKPMLKELTREGDAAIEVHMKYKGEVRITVEATAVINLGARFKSYTVKLELAAVLRELEGNLLIRVKRPPSNRIWYAFTQTPRIVLEVEPIVSDRQITWGMILSTIESKFKEIIQESVVMPNMDDISFFETGMFEHRGGIFAEACRKPHEAPPPSPVPPPAVPDDVQSVLSAPLPDTEPEDPGAQPIARAATDVGVVSTDSEPTRKITRKRSWFAKGEAEVEAGAEVEAEVEDEIRGRALEPEPMMPVRSQSTPKPGVAGLRPTTPTPEVQSTAHARRSSSSHISIKEPADEDTGPRSTPSTPRKSSGEGRPASPPSFFSTLKSKAAAADKQALSNTAKEAMRKWGVNWAGFKKDASGDEGGSGSPPRGGLAVDSSLLGKARTSYAEVRAAVAERKERERPVSGLLEESAEAGPSRMRVVSMGSRMPNGSVYADAPGNPGVVSAAGRLGKKAAVVGVSVEGAEGEGVEVAETAAPIHVQPVAKTMSIPGIHVSHRGDVQSMGYVAPVTEEKKAVYRLFAGEGRGRAGSVGGTPPPLPPRASDALQTIAAQDVSSRSGEPPALPPRRVVEK